MLRLRTVDFWWVGLNDLTESLYINIFACIECIPPPANMACQQIEPWACCLVSLFILSSLSSFASLLAKILNLSRNPVLPRICRLFFIFAATSWHCHVGKTSWSSTWCFPSWTLYNASCIAFAAQSVMSLPDACLHIKLGRANKTLEH